MDFNSTIDIIIKDLEEARLIIEDLKKYPGVPALQVELAKAKCKSAEDIMELLKTIQLNVQAPAVPQKETEAKSYKPEKTEVLAEPPKPPIPAGPSHEIQEKPETRTEDKTVKKVKPGRTEILPGEIYGPEILADRFSLEDKNDFLKSSHFDSLSEAIGINDKFLFLREIFNDNRELYSRVISELDSVSTIQDAREIINTYTTDDSSRLAGKQLLDLVKRKLRADE